MKLKYQNSINSQTSQRQQQAAFYAPQQRESPPKYQPHLKENQPPSKLAVYNNANQQVAPVPIRPTAPLYASEPYPNPTTVTNKVHIAPSIAVKRDPPAGLLAGAQRRQPPNSLMNKSLGNQSFNSEQLINNSLLYKNNTVGAASLNMSTIGLQANTKRQPPASLAGGGNNTNNSMDLSTIMNKLNQSPAPSTLRR